MSETPGPSPRSGPSQSPSLHMASHKPFRSAVQKYMNLPSPLQTECSCLQISYIKISLVVLGSRAFGVLKTWGQCPQEWDYGPYEKDPIEFLYPSCQVTSQQEDGYVWTRQHALTKHWVCQNLGLRLTGLHDSWDINFWSSQTALQWQEPGWTETLPKPLFLGSKYLQTLPPLPEHPNRPYHWLLHLPLQLSLALSGCYFL